jgi:hypothetical protein
VKPVEARSIGPLVCDFSFKARRFRFAASDRDAACYLLSAITLTRDEFNKF